MRDDHVASRGLDNVPFTEDDLYSASVERKTVIENGRSSISTRVRTPTCCSYTQGVALKDLDIIESKLSVFDSAFLPGVWFEAKESYSLVNPSGQKFLSGQVRVLENANALNDAFDIGFYDARLNCVPHDEITFEPCSIPEEVIKASSRGQTMRLKTKAKVLPENTWALEGGVDRDSSYPNEFAPYLWTFILINRL